MNELIPISKIETALAEATEFIDVLDIRDAAKAATILAEARGMGDVAQDAKIIQLKAERKAGAFLDGLERGQENQYTKVASNNVLPPASEYAQALEENNLGKMTSSRWQKLAEIPDDDFKKWVQESKDSGKEITQAGALRYQAAKARPLAKSAPELPDGVYSVIYADPPWSYGNSGVIGETDSYGHVGRHYQSMTIPELCALPIKGMVADSAVMFLWVTSPLLEECFPVIKAWGFKYKTSFVWDKIKHNFGHYNSVRHELLLVCTRGSYTPQVNKLFDSVQSIERTKKHSEKPEEFRVIIDTIYPHGPRIELFARADAENWDTWGNEK